jgi:hypothetical protein
MRRDPRKLKKRISVIVILSLLNVASLLLMSTVSNTPFLQDGTNVLFNTWFLDTYKIESEVYLPNKREKSDFILFKKDKSYTSMSEGKEEKGTFILNTSGAYVVMIYEKGDKTKAYIISISKKSLILKYDIDEIRDVEVHYNSSIQ